LKILFSFFMLLLSWIAAETFRPSDDALAGTQPTLRGRKHQTGHYGPEKQSEDFLSGIGCPLFIFKKPRFRGEI
jgi:hypothetical protein